LPRLRFIIFVCKTEYIRTGICSDCALNKILSKLKRDVTFTLLLPLALPLSVLISFAGSSAYRNKITQPGTGLGDGIRLGGKRARRLLMIGDPHACGSSILWLPSTDRGWRNSRIDVVCLIFEFSVVTFKFNSFAA